MILELGEQKQKGTDREALRDGLLVGAFLERSGEGTSRGRSFLREIQLEGVDLRSGQVVPSRASYRACAHHPEALRLREDRGGMQPYLFLLFDPDHNRAYQSRPMEEIVDEVRGLVAQGVKEFQMIAQDLTFYGLDRYKRMALPELVERVSDIPGVEWIRLHYGYPSHFPYDLLPVMRERDNVCKYMDIAPPAYQRPDVEDDAPQYHEAPRPYELLERMASGSAGYPSTHHLDGGSSRRDGTGFRGVDPLRERYPFRAYGRFRL